MSFSMAGAGARGPQINITPRIDVLLTLIIVFMVVISMDKERGETAQIPHRSEADGQHLAAAHRRHPGTVDEPELQLALVMTGLRQVLISTISGKSA